jgi:hypothetical protein
MWGGWLLVLAIVVIITAGGLLTQRYLDRSAEDMASQLAKVQQAVERGDWKDGESSFTALDERWNRVSSNWALFTDHLELDNLELRLVRLHEFIQARDYVNAKAEAGEAEALLRHIPERVRLTWHNVF